MNIQEQEVFYTLTPENKKHHLYFDELSENIFKNVPKQNQKYIKKQLDKLNNNFMNYLCYWNEKYYRNGFVDGVQITIGRINTLRSEHICSLLRVFNIFNFQNKMHI